MNNTSSPQLQLLTILPSTLPPATVGTPYTATLSVSGGFIPYTWTVLTGTCLPDGLTLTQPTDGLGATISGTPTTAVNSPFEFGLRVVDASGIISTIVYSLIVFPATPITHDFGDGRGPINAQQHPYGGGWIDGIANVAPEVWVDENAVVYVTPPGYTIWAPSTPYGVDSIVWDPTSGLYYIGLEAHTSSLVFADDAAMWAMYGGTVTVSGDVKIYDTAKVFGIATLSGRAQVYGNAQVFDRATLTDTAQAYESALVYGDAVMSGSSQAYGSSQVYGEANVSGNAQLRDNAQANESAVVTENAVIRGDAVVTDSAKVAGTAVVQGLVTLQNDSFVYGSAVIDENVVIEDGARISGSAILRGSAVVLGEAQVNGTTVVDGNARIEGLAKVYGTARVGDNAMIKGTAQVYGNARVGGTVVVQGAAQVFGTATLIDNTVLDGTTVVSS